MSYASDIGARPSTRAEKESRGLKSSTRAYTLPDGSVVSHRQMQTMGLRNKYNLERPSLEQRAEYRREVMGVKSPRTVFDSMVHHAATTPIRNGGMGLRYDRKTRQYIDPRTGERFGFQDIARSGDFRDKETGIWSQWQRIRHTKGPRGQRQRFNFLRRYGKLVHIGGNKYRYVA